MSTTKISDHKNQAMDPTKSSSLSEKKKDRSLRSLFSFRKKKDDYEKVFEKPIENLKLLYKKSILPLEKNYKFDSFFSPCLTDPDFDAKPIVLLVGQYSTGKTSFIKFLLERDFPGIRIGPEPTTDRFVSVMLGKKEKAIPGNAAAAQNDKPFSALKKFGMNFLNKFECAELNAPILQNMTFIDTPGILAGSEQTEERSYEYIQVIKWFAERADRILIFFDSNKLDISNQMKDAIETLRCNEDKIMCILNKADSVSSQQLTRIYGALMWSLGKTIRTPEVPRVYISSFWDKPYKNMEQKKMFDAEKVELISDLRSLKPGSVLRKINELMKRAKMLKIHILIISHLKSKMGIFGKDKKKAKMIDNMEKIFSEIQAEQNLPKGDFPDAESYKKVLAEMDLKNFKKVKAKEMELIEKVLSKDIPDILDQFPNLQKSALELENEEGEEREVANPFDGDENVDGISPNSQVLHDDDLEKGGWAIFGSIKKKFDGSFDRVSEDGKDVPAGKAKKMMLNSGLSLATLKKIWDLSDMDKNNALDRDEFAVCFHLIELFKSGKGDDIGDALPYELIPPSKRSD